MAMFDGVKVGQKLWDYQDGWVEVTEIDLDSDYPITATSNRHGGSYSFTLEGLADTTDIFPTLFWDEVKIVPPEKPKESCPRCEQFVYKHTCEKAENPEKPKVECEACSEIRFAEWRLGQSSSHDQYFSADLRRDKFLLNQHHACSKVER